MRTIYVFLICALLCVPAHASSAPKHLASWAAQLYAMSMPFEEEAVRRADRIYHDGQKVIFEQAKPLLELSDIREWSRDPVVVEKLEHTWDMPTQFQMELVDGAMLRIDWVEEHLNLTVEKEGEDGFTFMLLGLIDIKEQEDGTVLLPIRPHEDIVHYQFHNEKTQENYFPGLIVTSEEDAQ